jgi:integrase
MFPVFGLELSKDHNVRLLVKRVATLVGKDPANYSAHSLRKSMATIADRADIDVDDIQKGLWHTKRETTLGYIKAQEVENNPAFTAVAQALG